MQRVLDTLLAHDEAALMPGACPAGARCFPLFYVDVDPDSIFALEQTSQVQWPASGPSPVCVRSR